LTFNKLRNGFSIKNALYGALVFQFRKHFLTESERSGERLLQAARRVSGSESITGLTGAAGARMFFVKFTGIMELP
jgi:hypothetical protein